MSDAISRALLALEASLIAAMPTCIVSTDFVDFTQRRADELQRGVITLLHVGGDTSSEWETLLTLKLVAQVTVPERTSSQRALRDAELALLQGLRAWINNPGREAPSLQTTGYKTSGQMEFPNGWVAIELTAGPLDLADGEDSEIYPPGMLPGTTSGLPLGELNRVWMGFDLAPRQDQTIHSQWLAENYATPPDLSTLVELPHANNPD